MDFKTMWQGLQASDAARSGFPAEHGWVFVAGVGLLLLAGSRRSALSRALLRTVATGLLARAASGRGGLRSVRR